jgi:beta-lactam-binding protein with PASTA domain
VTDTLTRERAIPLVDGRPVREATLALHQSGFRVSLKGLGRVSRTLPATGETAKAGTTVVVWAE